MMIKDNLEFYDIYTTSSRNQAVDIHHRDTYHFDQDSPYSITKCIKWYTTMPGRTKEDTCSIYTDIQSHSSVKQFAMPSQTAVSGTSYWRNVCMQDTFARAR